MTIKYKYNEGDLLRQITDYVNSTYDEHYSQNKFQATEFIIDGGHGVGFTIGNIMKYAQRYGHKGGPADWRKDLMKVIHYAIIAMYVHDKENEEDTFIMPPDWDENRVDEYSLKTVLYGNGDTIDLTGTTVTSMGYVDMGTNFSLTNEEIGSISITDTKKRKSKGNK